MNELRFIKYQDVTIKKSFKLENLPPTEEAAKQHCYRAYFYLQFCLGNKLRATEWGWKSQNNVLVPNLTDADLIPEKLLKTISCGCETTCDKRNCGCRKHGLKCTNLCSNCPDSEHCSNLEEKIYEDILESEQFDDENLLLDTINNDASDQQDPEDLEETEIESDLESDHESASDNESSASSSSDYKEPPSKRKK